MYCVNVDVFRTNRRSNEDYVNGFIGGHFCFRTNDYKLTNPFGDEERRRRRQTSNNNRLPGAAKRM